MQNLNSIGISSSSLSTSAGNIGASLSSTGISLSGAGSLNLGGVKLSGTALLRQKMNSAMAVAPAAPAFGQGTSLFNAGYINALADQINNVTNCAALQIMVANCLNSIQALIQAEIQSQLAILQDYLPILNLPTDPLKIISWAEKLVLGTVLPQLKAYISYAMQLIQTLKALQKLEQAIMNAEKNVIACAISIQAELLAGAQKMVSGAIGTALSSIGSMQAQINDMVIRVNPLAATLSIDTTSADSFMASADVNLPSLSLNSIMESK